MTPPRSCPVRSCPRPRLSLPALATLRNRLCPRCRLNCPGMFSLSSALQLPCALAPAVRRVERVAWDLETRVWRLAPTHVRMPRHADDAVLDISTQAVQFIDDEHLVAFGIDVR